MSSSGPRPHGASSTVAPSAVPERSYFETQRAELIGEIAASFEHVLQNINKLNRALEGVIAVGNEFSSVEALWSQFENVMAKDQDGETAERQEGQQEGSEAEHDDASSEEASRR